MNDASDNYTPVTMSDIAEENLEPPELEAPEVYPSALHLTVEDETRPEYEKDYK